MRGAHVVPAAGGTARVIATPASPGHVGADPNLGVTHDDLDVEPGAAVAHHDLVAGAAVAAGPADLAELGLTVDGDVGVIGQA